MIFETVGVVGAAASLVVIYVSAFFIGGRRWRGNYEAEHTRAERLQATLTEKDLILEGQSERLARLDEVVQELGGHRVSQKIVEGQSENLRLFKGIADNLTAHEERAAARHEAIMGGFDHLAEVNEDGFKMMSGAFRQGKDVE